MNVKAQEVEVAVFLFFGCDCEGPNLKYEKMIKMKGTLPRFFFKFLSKYTVFGEQFDSFLFDWNFESREVRSKYIQKGENLMLAKEIEILI